MDHDARSAVVVFGFVRPRHLERLLVSLYRNPEAAALPVFVRIDGGRTDQERAWNLEAEKVASRFVPQENITLGKRNRGVRASIVEGVSELLTRFDSVIVLEEDLVVSDFFLKFMLDGISRYRAEPRVASIHGYLLPGSPPLVEPFFLRGADCWGWATWRSAWAGYEDDAAELLSQLRWRGLEWEFSFGGHSPHLRLLELAAAGQVDSWAIRWHASTFLSDRYTLYPSESLVANHGHDGSGTHSPTLGFYDTTLATSPLAIPDQIAWISKDGWERHARFYRQKSMSKRRRILGHRLRRFVPSMIRRRASGGD